MRLNEVKCLFFQINFFKRIIVFSKFTNYYANSNIKLVKKNQKLHNSDLPFLVGEVNDDVVMEVNEPSYIETREKVLPLRRTFQSTLF